MGSITYIEWVNLQETDLPILHKDVIAIDEMKQDVANYIEELFHD